MRHIDQALSNGSCGEAAEVMPSGEVADLVAAGLVRRHLMRVMGERNPPLRREAAAAIYTRNCFIMGPDEVLGLEHFGTTRYGRDAACLAASRLQALLPGSAFTPGGVAVRDGSVACQRWTFGPREYPAQRRGVEVALVGRKGIEACFSVADEGLQPLDLKRICEMLVPEDRWWRSSHQAWVREGSQLLAATWP